jgi:L-fucono-1,5-lactonase
MTRLDAHQHFWRYQAADYPWIGTGMDVVRRDWLPQDLRLLLEAHGLDGCIAVQARSSAEETEFLLELAKRFEWIAGVVGWVDLRAADLTAELARWQGQAKLVGFRHLIQDEPDAEALLADPAFNRGVAALQTAGLTYDVLVRAPQLRLIPAFCARHDRHWLVLDHLGKPAIGAGRESDAEWRAQLARVAALPHVACKLSGLVTEVGDRAVDAAELCRYLDTALGLFGSRRLLFGSDWPVCLLKAEYSEVFELIDRWAAPLSEDERAALFGGTAARCYGLALTATRGVS